MIITGMVHFESVCKKKLVEWYNKNDDIYHTQQRIDLDNVYVVWACKTLQNYKALLSTTVSGDGIYAEYTYNGDKQELYEDVYQKVTNAYHTEEQSISGAKIRTWTQNSCFENITHTPWSFGIRALFYLQKNMELL